MCCKDSFIQKKHNTYAIDLRTSASLEAAIIKKIARQCELMFTISVHFNIIKWTASIFGFFFTTCAVCTAPRNSPQHAVDSGWSHLLCSCWVLPTAVSIHHKYAWYFIELFIFSHILSIWIHFTGNGFKNKTSDLYPLRHQWRHFSLSHLFKRTSHDKIDGEGSDEPKLGRKLLASNAGTPGPTGPQGPQGTIGPTGVIGMQIKTTEQLRKL